jgi:hypothetical protein
MQHGFQTVITKNSSEIRMGFTAITDGTKENMATNQELLRSIFASRVL